MDPINVCVRPASLTQAKALQWDGTENGALDVAAMVVPECTVREIAETNDAFLMLLIFPDRGKLDEIDTDCRSRCRLVMARNWVVVYEGGEVRIFSDIEFKERFVKLELAEIGE